MPSTMQGPSCVLLCLIHFITALTDEEKKILVDKQNFYRSQMDPPAAGMKMLHWDTNLEDLATSYAAKCIWEHNEDRGFRGENLFMMSGSGLDVGLGLDDWHRERDFYNFTTNICQEGQMCGHYTQMVWADTERVGCGMKFCEKVEGFDEQNMYLLVCNYEPPGNFEGEKPYKIGVPCSACPPTHICKESLCAGDPDLWNRSSEIHTLLQGSLAKTSYPLDSALLNFITALTDEEKKILVDKQNFYRSQMDPPAAGMKMLHWDTNLEDLATSYAAKCIWEHNEDRGFRGENLFMMSGSGLDVGLGLDDWHRERDFYNFTTNICQEGQMCGHYTQMVWADTERVGCGMKFCEKVEGFDEQNMYLLVCNYEPPGNFEGEKPYKIGVPCSACPPTHICKESLCADKDIEQKERSTAGPDPTQSELMPETTQSKLVPDPTQSELVPETTQSELMPDPTQSELMPDPTQSELMPDPTQSELVPDPTQSELMPDPTQSELVPDPTQSELMPDPTQSELLPDPTQSELVPDPTQSELVPDPTQSELMPNPTQSELMSDQTQSELVPDPTQSELMPNPTQSELMPNPTQSELMPDPTQSELMPDPTQSELMSDQTQSELMPEITQSELVPETTPWDLVPDPTQSEMMADTAQTTPKSLEISSPQDFEQVSTSSHKIEHPTLSMWSSSPLETATKITTDKIFSNNGPGASGGKELIAPVTISNPPLFSKKPLTEDISVLVDKDQQDELKDSPLPVVTLTLPAVLPPSTPSVQLTKDQKDSKKDRLETTKRPLYADPRTIKKVNKEKETNKQSINVILYPKKNKLRLNILSKAVKWNFKSDTSEGTYFGKHAYKPHIKQAHRAPCPYPCLNPPSKYPLVSPLYRTNHISPMGGPDKQDGTVIKSFINPSTKQLCKLFGYKRGIYSLYLPQTGSSNNIEENLTG
ncbi:uncharacterized protein LOC142096023 isoform X2 [Mixophyes fleayi]|uniref:uncharacterized protein LOC142096023 isoform X2 n=1 Tax=Mixophyes fleayi TaxID=3061075 RepID=UPI003F4D960C